VLAGQHLPQRAQDGGRFARMALEGVCALDLGELQQPLEDLRRPLEVLPTQAGAFYAGVFSGGRCSNGNVRILSGATGEELYRADEDDHPELRAPEAPPEAEASAEQKSAGE